MGLSEQRLADEADLRTGVLGRDGRSKARAAGAHDEHVDWMRLDLAERLRSDGHARFP
jgi:hypothetical protein